LLLHLAPGNPIDIMLATSRGSREVREVLMHRFGLDQPLYVQYFLWLYNTFTGNLGISVNGLPVVDVIAPRIWYTIELMLVSQILSATLAVALGALAGYKHDSTLDRALSFLALIGYSIPNFWLGLVLILVFAVALGWFPVGGFSMGIELAKISGLSSVLLHLEYLALPTAVLVIEFTPYYFRLLRSSMIEVARSDYIVTARSKGLTERTIIYKHALRNALIPLVTAVGTSLGLIFGGSYVVEVVFAWPGLGSLLVIAALSRDYWVVMGVSLITATMVIASSITIDIAYAYLNPKIRFGGAGL
jgi:ABC-type dipeptide/oligopeptide/nickel transport system permease component